MQQVPFRSHTNHWLFFFHNSHPLSQVSSSLFGLCNVFHQKKTFLCPSSATGTTYVYGSPPSTNLYMLYQDRSRSTWTFNQLLVGGRAREGGPWSIREYICIRNKEEGIYGVSVQYIMDTLKKEKEKKKKHLPGWDHTYVVLSQATLHGSLQPPGRERLFFFFLSFQFSSIFLLLRIIHHSYIPIKTFLVMKPSLFPRPRGTKSFRGMSFYNFSSYLKLNLCISNLLLICFKP